MAKKERCRAIIIINNQIVAMYRETNNRTFYTFPGGGLEGNETEIECVKREVFEEYGMVVEPIKKVYIYENEISREHFFVCKHISGKFGTGEGEEYLENQTKGVYIPKMLDIANLNNLPLFPSEITQLFIADFSANGESLRNDVLQISANMQK